jgi:uncharacterized surface protein with fasciclin (FAS1) repeats
MDDSCRDFAAVHPTRSISMQRTFHRLATVTLALAISAGAVSAMAASVMVGGAPMLPTKDIIDNAVNSKDHTTLVAAVKAAGLVDTLKGPGPFTVFAPTNAAFAEAARRHRRHAAQAREQGRADWRADLPRGAGKLDAAALKKEIKAGKGSADLKTAAGGTLVAKEKGGKITLTDEKGGTATVTIANVYQSNGVIHVVDKVLLPK